MVTAVELESAHKKAEIGIQPFAQINFDKKYQTNQIQDMKRTNNQTLKIFISEKIAYKRPLLSSSNFVSKSNSETGLFGNTGRIAPEKTKNCNEANHSLIFKESINLSILVLKVLTPVIKIVKIIAILSRLNQIKTQIRKTSRAQSSAVIQCLFNLNVHEICEIESNTNIEINKTAGI
jgi:hypothetical protein